MCINIFPDALRLADVSHAFKKKTKLTGQHIITTHAKGL